MALLTQKERMIGFSVRKKAGIAGGCGFARCGNTKCGSAYEMRGIFQQRHMKKGIDTIKMRAYRSTNPRTDPQQANRSKFADAMAAWMALTDDQKAAYTKRAKRRAMFGWGLFVRDYFQSH